jgi:hypothetical protein
METVETVIKNMKDSTENPDWDRIENDVVTRIRALKALWEHWDACEVPVVGPWLKDKVIADIVVPNLELLAAFCLAVKIKDVDKP